MNQNNSNSNSNNNDHFYLTAYGGDDESHENFVTSPGTEHTSHSYLHSPLVDDDSVSVHSSKARRPAQQLSLRREAGREGRMRMDDVGDRSSGGALYGEPLYETDHEDYYGAPSDYTPSDYGPSGVVSMSKPFGRRRGSMESDQQRIMEKLDDSHLDREFESQPSRGPTTYQRMQFMNDTDDESDTPLRRASTLLKRQLSKRRQTSTDGALRRSLLAHESGPYGGYGEANIPLQNLTEEDERQGMG
ncbi:hypothetical protein EV175_006891, partial [Coemansia sp. RSA 1933]